YRLGDSVAVKVMRVDLDERKIDFEIAQDVADTPTRKRRGADDGGKGARGAKGDRAPAAGNASVQKSREIKQALMAESKSKSGKAPGKGRSDKADSAKPASPGKHRKGPPKAGAASTGAPRKRK